MNVNQVCDVLERPRSTIMTWIKDLDIDIDVNENVDQKDVDLLVAQSKKSRRVTRKSKSDLAKCSRRFYVWTEETGYTKHPHDKIEDAKIEAERLAKQHPGRRYTVMGELCSVVVNGVEWY